MANEYKIKNGLIIDNLSGNTGLLSADFEGKVYSTNIQLSSLSNNDNIDFLSGNIRSKLTHNNNIDIQEGSVTFKDVNSTYLTGDVSLGITISGEPELLAIAENGLIYITALDGDAVHVYDPILDSLIETISMPVTGFEVQNISYCPSNKSLYVTNDVNKTTDLSNGIIRVLDSQTHQWTDNVLISGALSGVAGNDLEMGTYCPTNGFLYGTFDSSTVPFVYVLDPSTNTEVTEITGLDGRPFSITYCPFNNRLYVGHLINNTCIDVIDPQLNILEDQICTNQLDLPQHGVYCPDTELLYFGGSASETIYIIDPRINELIDQIDLSTEIVKNVAFLRYNPKNKRLYGLGYQGGAEGNGISIINPFTNTIEQEIYLNTGGLIPWAEFSYDTNLMYVIDQASEKLLRIT